jgi:hypothetical protein
MLVFVGYTVAMRHVPARLTPLPQFAVMSIRREHCNAALRGGRNFLYRFAILDERTLPWVAVVVLATGIGAYLGYNARSPSMARC